MWNAVAASVLGIWLYLLVGRGWFWLCRERDDRMPPAPAKWPSVVAVVPARNEADCVGLSVASLSGQDYPGHLAVILVDDDSDDRTSEIAQHAAMGFAARRPFQLVRSQSVPSGWTGKLWALKQGLDAAGALEIQPKYLLFTDADIVHSADCIRSLVARAEERACVLTSLMAKLRCRSFAERSHVPAFVFFFQMLFPFSWVNDQSRRIAAAAGGCMLVKAEALAHVGGIESIRDALIDDCSLARKMKATGPIWLGLTDRVHSLRAYERWGDIKRMISRSAYAQLKYSPINLAAVTLLMALTFLVGPMLAMFGDGLTRLMGGTIWALMALAFLPILRFYRVSPLWSFALPAIAGAYMLYTLDSCWQYLRGEGGKWKGRVQANASCS